MLSPEENKCHVLVIYMDLIPSAQIIMNMLSEFAGKYNIIVRGKKSIQVKQRDIQKADSVLFIRGADLLMPKIAKAASRTGRFCMMYLDDDLLSFPDKKDNEYKKALRECLSYCDMLWSSNQRILDKYSKYLPSNRTMNEVAFFKILKMMRPTKTEGDTKIVFAGSMSHLPALKKYVIPALNELYKKGMKFQTIFIGIDKSEVVEMCSHIQCIPWFSSVEEYNEYMEKEQFQIGIAVVDDSEFSKCKFYNKYLEYTKQGILGIYSNSDPYRMVVKDNVNGLLCDNTIQDWESRLEKAILFQEFRVKCVMEAQKMLENYFNMDNVLANIKQYIPELVTHHGYGRVSYRGVSFVERCLNCIFSNKYIYNAFMFVVNGGNDTDETSVRN